MKSLNAALVLLSFDKRSSAPFGIQSKSHINPSLTSREARTSSIFFFIADSSFNDMDLFLIHVNSHTDNLLNAYTAVPYL